MSNAINTTNSPLFLGLQTALGTPATTNFKKFHLISGNIKTDKQGEKAEWLDGSRYSNAFDYTASIQVTGQFTVQGSADAIGFLAACALGTDVSVGEAVPYTHTINPGNTIPFLTSVGQLGIDSNSQIHEHSDIQIVSVKIDSSSDNDVVTAEVEVVGLTPGKTRAALPSATSETDDPFLHYNGEDNFVFAGLNSGGAVKDVSQSSITIQNGLTPYFGDSSTPTSLVAGRGEIMVDFTVLATDETLPLLNKYYYGTASPSTGAYPVTDVFKEEFGVKYTTGASTTLRSVEVIIPELVFKIDEYPEASADGNPIEIACTGEARVANGDSVSDIITIEAVTADPNSYSDNSAPEEG